MSSEKGAGVGASASEKFMQVINIEAKQQGAEGASLPHTYTSGDLISGIINANVQHDVVV